MPLSQCFVPTLPCILCHAGKINEDTHFMYVHPKFVITTDAGEEAPKLTWGKLRNMIL